MSTHPNLLSCDPEDFATFLLRERFDNNSKETATFLLQALSCLPDAEALSTELSEHKDDESEASVELGEHLVPPVELSMIMPRAKLMCSLLAEGVHCVNSKRESFDVISKNVSKLIIFPKAEDMRKKEARNMVLLILEEEINFKKKTLNRVCFQLPQNDPSAFLEKLKICLKMSENEICFVGGGNNKWNFKSHDEGNTSTTTAGMPFVTCYKGVQDGHLYPLEDGLLFFKPPYFIPRQSLHSIACGRGASGSSRYVDMNIQLDNDETIEFTNIHREELNVLNDYIHKILIPAMKRDVNEDADIVNEEETESEDDADMADSLRPRRKACRVARHATKKEMEIEEEESSDEDEDDADFISQENIESESEDSGTGEESGTEGGSLENEKIQDDEFEEDEFFEEAEENSDDDVSTEEDDTFQPKRKRRKNGDGDA
mmetsp:Transcript_25970/g.39321  ORF Transcript_25970/g.39321 Transcript_25970/m.39321 type:complete len:431 (+) Transcript_25970:70-1362(+)